MCVKLYVMYMLSRDTAGNLMGSRFKFKCKYESVIKKTPFYNPQHKMMLNWWSHIYCIVFYVKIMRQLFSTHRNCFKIFNWKTNFCFVNVSELCGFCCFITLIQYFSRHLSTSSVSFYYYFKIIIPKYNTYRIPQIIYIWLTKNIISLTQSV